MKCGCLSKTTSAKEEENVIEEERAAPILTEQSAEERALTQLKVIFESIDVNKDGTVNHAELVAAWDKDAKLGALIKEAGLNQEHNALQKMEKGTNGRVTWEEFEQVLKTQAVAEVRETGNVAAAEKPADEKALERLRKIFDGLDRDNDKAVNRQELGDGLNEDENIGKLVALAGLNPNFCVLEQLDSDLDGKITWEEFETHLRKAAKKEIMKEGDLAAAMTLAEAAMVSFVEEEDKAIVPSNGFFWCF